MNPATSETNEAAVPNCAACALPAFTPARGNAAGAPIICAACESDLAIYSATGTMPSWTDVVANEYRGRHLMPSTRVEPWRDGTGDPLSAKAGAAVIDSTRWLAVMVGWHRSRVADLRKRQGEVHAARMEAERQRRAEELAARAEAERKARLKAERARLEEQKADLERRERELGAAE